MEPDWEKVKEIFGEAIELNGPARASYLSEACADRAELRAEVERLLRESDDTEGPLSEPSIWKPPDVFSCGDVIENRFLVVRLIGRGGMGEVYEVHDRLLNRPLAMKTLPGATTRSADALGRFKREILMGQRVSHPNVCRVHDAILTNVGSAAVLSFTMELLQGETLAHHLARCGPLSEAQGWAIAMQMAAGLGAIHGAGLVHRDFKPANVVLTQVGDEMRAVITDFGLTRPGSNMQAENIWRSRTGQIMGTESYMAPEQKAGKEVTPAADVYSMGVVLLEMLQMPRLGRPPLTARKRLSSFWASLIRRCMREEPAERPQDAKQVREELAGFLKNQREPPKL